MLDVAGPDAFYTAGDYARAARAAIAEISGRGRVPIVSGGTGLYLRALLQGLSPGPQRSPLLRERLQRKAETRGPVALHRILRRIDPASADRIHPNDLRKVIRALEVRLTSSRPMGDIWKEGREPLTGFRVLRLGLNPERGQLYERIDARAAAMFAQGLAEETKDLIARYGRTPALASLGYRQAVQYLDSEITLEQATVQASQGHRNYAKRQLTWFRREPEVHWLSGFGDDVTVRAEAERLVMHART